MPGAIDYTIRRSWRPWSHHPGDGLHLDLRQPTTCQGLCRAEVRVHVQGLSTTSKPSESIEVLTVWLISADFVANALHEHQEGYNVPSDGGDEARCGRCYTTTVRR